MCYDISFHTNIKTIVDYFPGIQVDPEIGVKYEMVDHLQIREERDHPIILVQEDQLTLKPMRWGIEMFGRMVFNTQSEKVLQKGSAWYNRRQSRCLIPVTGIMEHREVKGWSRKVPYLVKIKNKDLFCIPGLYSKSQNAWSLITRPANEVMCMIHNSGDNPFRMPLFLQDKKLELRWIDKDLPEPEMAAILDFELESEELSHITTWTIRTSKERPDKKSKLDPYEWPGLPPLGHDTISPTLF